MKYFSFFVITFLCIASCCGTQKAIEDRLKENTKIAVVTRAPNTVEAPSIPGTPQPPKPHDDIHMEETFIPLPPKPPKPPKQIETSTLSHSRWNKLLQQFVSANGNVDYQKIREDRFQLDIYIDILNNNIPTKEWSKNEKIAYWINTYNALTIDLIRRNYPTKNIKDIKDPWDQRLWQFGDKWINLNEIEHEILRKMNEPRIHFALVCASVSCPKLKNEAFTAANLDAQLTEVTKAFLADTSKNKLSKDRIKLSKIFKWFKADFEQDGSLIDFLNQYSDVSISNSAKKSYTDYNWDLND